MDPKPPHATAGVIFVGMDIALVIYGVTCLQCLYYYRWFQRDSKLVKGAVGVVWLLLTMSIAMFGYTMMHYLLLERTPDVFRRRPPWTVCIQSATNSVTSSIIHAVLGWRIWILSNKRVWLIAIIICLSTTQLLFGLSNAVNQVAFHASRERSRQSSFVFGTLVSMVAADSAVTISLCALLHRHKTPNARSTGILNGIILHTINNGVLSCSLAVFALICMIVLPHIWLSYAALWILGQAYFNTLLSTLNSRRKIQRRLNEHDLTSILGTVAIQRRIDDVENMDRKSGDTDSHSKYDGSACC